MLPLTIGLFTPPRSIDILTFGSEKGTGGMKVNDVLIQSELLQFQGPAVCEGWFTVTPSSLTVSSEDRRAFSSCLQFVFLIYRS